MKLVRVVLVSSLLVLGCNTKDQNEKVTDDRRPVVTDPVRKPENAISLQDWNELTYESSTWDQHVPSTEALFDKTLSDMDIRYVTRAERQAALAKLNADGVAFRDQVAASCFQEGEKTQSGKAERFGDVLLTKVHLQSVGPNCEFEGRVDKSVSSKINKISLDNTGKPTYLDATVGTTYKVTQKILTSNIQQAVNTASISLTMSSSGSQVLYREGSKTINAKSLKGSGTLSFVSAQGETVVLRITTQYVLNIKSHYSTFVAEGNTSNGAVNFVVKTNWTNGVKASEVYFNGTRVDKEAFGLLRFAE